MTQKLLTLLLFLSIVSFSQNNKDKNDLFLINKGGITYGGNFSIDFGNGKYGDKPNSTSSDSFGFGVTPKIGFAVKNNFVLGFGITYAYSESNATNNSDGLTNNTNNNAAGVLFFLEKYYGLTKKLAFHIQGETSYRKIHSEIESVGNTDVTSYQSNFETKRLFIGFRPGLTYSIKDNLWLQTNIGSLGYTNIRMNQNQADRRVNSFGFNLNTSDFMVGLIYVN